MFNGMLKKGITDGNSLAVQWLGLHAFTSEGPGSIPGRGNKIPRDPTSHAAWPKKKKRRN